MFDIFEEDLYSGERFDLNLAETMCAVLLVDRHFKTRLNAGFLFDLVSGRSKLLGQRNH